MVDTSHQDVVPSALAFLYSTQHPELPAKYCNLPVGDPRERL